MQDIKAILFDFGGTLDNDGVDWYGRIYQGIAVRTGDLDAEEFHRVAKKSFEQISDLDDTCRLSMEQTVHRVCRHIHINMDNGNNGNSKKAQWDPAQVADEFLAEAHRHLNRNRQVLAELSGRFRLGCISNNWGNTAGWCRHYQLSEYFETMIDSTVVGAAKPDIKIFRSALDQMKLPAELCAYVGDRYDCDVLGSHAAGFRPIWITNNHTDQAETEQTVKPIKITKLPELLDL